MITFDHVSKTYPNGVKGLIDVNLTINDGDFVSIIGLSGAGKSTLLRSINRLNEITEGEITIDGQSITKANKRELKRIRRTIGLISQQFNLVKRSTVQKNVLSGKLGYYSTLKSIFGLFSKEDYALCNEVLKKVELEDKLHERCDNLSGGQQQRVSIARALAMKPKMLFFDEPTSALDPELTGEILKVIRGLAAEHMTMVIVTHEMAFARDVSDHVIFMDGGVIVEQGNPTDIINNPTHERTIQFLSRFN